MLIITFMMGYGSQNFNDNVDLVSHKIFMIHFVFSCC